MSEAARINVDMPVWRLQPRWDGGAVRLDMELAAGDAYLRLTPARARELAEQLNAAADEGDSPSPPPPRSDYEVARVMMDPKRHPTHVLVYGATAEIPDCGKNGSAFFGSRVDAALNEVGWQLRRPVDRDEDWVDSERGWIVVRIERIPTHTPPPASEA